MLSRGYDAGVSERPNTFGGDHAASARERWWIACWWAIVYVILLPSGVIALAYHAVMHETMLGLGVAFAAFCVWLTVRIVNRRERWAIVVAAAIIALMTYALASFAWILHQFP